MSPLYGDVMNKYEVLGVVGEGKHICFFTKYYEELFGVLKTIFFKACTGSMSVTVYRFGNVVQCTDFICM